MKEDKILEESKDPALVWLEDVIILHTPHWAHVLAQLAQHRGLRWMYIFPIPLVRALTDVTVKTETNVKQPKKGFRTRTLLETRTMRVYKRGRMVAEKSFESYIKNSPYAKIV